MLRDTIHPTCLVLDKLEPAKHEYVGSGAILCLAKREDTVIEAVFDSAVSCGSWSWFSQDDKFRGCPMALGEPIDHTCDILVRCGKYKT